MDQQVEKTMKSYHEQLVDLRKLEEAATFEFNQAKTKLLHIKKKIREIEKLIDPPAN